MGDPKQMWAAVEQRFQQTFCGIGMRLGVGFGGKEGVVASSVRLPVPLACSAFVNTTQGMRAGVEGWDTGMR